MDEKISISIYKKDHDYLVKLKNKLKVTGVGVVVEKIVKAYKKHLSEEELK